MNVLMLVSNPCTHDARVIREAEALADAGHEVRVLAKWVPGTAREETRNGVVYHRHGTPRISNAAAPVAVAGTAGSPAANGLIVKPPLTIRARRLAGSLVRRGVLLFPRTGPMLLDQARDFTWPGVSFGPDVVHAHDLVTMLAGYRISRQTGAKFIYDSHELETGRNAKYTRLEKRLRARYEHYLITKTDAVITVSDSIADYLADLYKIKRPVVVLNAPSMTATAASGDHVRQRLGLSSETPLAVYVGSVTTNRGIENCVRALAHAPSLHIAAVGPRAAPVALSLMQDAKALGVENRFHLIDPVPHEDVTGFIRSADVSLILIQDTCLSYRFCFPNKLLESLLAGVPVLAAKLVELERIVAKTSAGLVVDQTNPAAIADGALKIARNRGRYAPGAETIEFIRRTYAWEQQRKVLLVLYGELGSKRKSLSAPAG
jgi:glycosyltransferase involved in cell wall biosynthesis